MSPGRTMGYLSIEARDHPPPCHTVRLEELSPTLMKSSSQQSEPRSFLD